MNNEDFIKFKSEYVSKTPSDFLLNAKTSNNDTNTSPSIILNAQILDLYERIKPKDFDKRRKVVNELNKVIQTFMTHKIKLEQFGSVASNNYLPSSDIDVRIQIFDFNFENVDQINLFLAKLNKNLLEESISSIFIAAKVPILKILFQKYKFDLSVSNIKEGNTLIKSNDHTKIFLKGYMELNGLKELHLLLKQYLINRNISLCNVAQFVICYNFLYFFPINCNIKNNIGVVLMDFFYYFGVVLNKKNFTSRISMKSYERSTNLCIEDPLNGNTISINFSLIQQSFFHSFHVMDVALKEFSSEKWKYCSPDIEFISLWFRNDHTKLQEIVDSDIFQSS